MTTENINSGKEIIEVLHRHFRNIIQCLFGQKRLVCR